MNTLRTVAIVSCLAISAGVTARATTYLELTAGVAGNGGGPFYQGGPGTVTLTVTNTGTTAGGRLSFVTDNFDANLTINSASAGCTIAAQEVTCRPPSDIPAGGGTAVFTINLTASPTAPSSIYNLANLTAQGGSDAAFKIIYITARPPNVDASFGQIALSGATDTPPCAVGGTFTATDVLKNTSGSTYTYPYAEILSLTQGNTLLSQSVSPSSIAPNATMTFTFKIRLASCNPFQLSFSVRGK